MHRSVIDAIGNTPLIRLKRASEETGCEILGKAEFMNPGQSVKDRAGLFIIRDAEKKGLLKPGGVIVEGTAGNTGIGLTLVAKALGYRTVIVIPGYPEPGEEGHAAGDGRRTDRSARGSLQEPQQLRQSVGPARRTTGQKRSERRHLGEPVRQRRQPRGHIRTTAEEIWTQTGGKVDGFVSAVGTGGTLAGVAFGLKAKKQGREDRAGRPAGRGAVQLLHRRRAEGRGLARSPKASGRGASPPIWRTSRPIFPIRYRTRRRCPTSST